MIRFEGVTRLYGAVKAVDRLDLAILDRELCVLVGPSGSGKSTMLRMINRLIEPTEGAVSLDGTDVRAMKPEILRRSIGYVIQNVGLFPHLTVAANVATVPQLLGWERPRIEARVERMLALVGMDPAVYRGRYPHELSGGEAQRIGVARALASDPPVILLDEPFSAVDPVTRLRLQDEFLSIQRELRKTVVFVTHDVDEAIRLADRIAVVRAGRLVQFDAPERILESPADPFVAAFVGADRALKRLSRFPVREYVKPAASARIDDEPGMRRAGARFLWIVDPAGTLIGSLDTTLAARCADLHDCISTENIREMAVQPDASLKEALSRMLGTSARTLPVVDAVFRLLGELSLSDVEEASERQTGRAAGEQP
ncbi:MAG: ABC transporter ATP-binding protein [Spirochaetia bacterium]|jgi:osmoprotectant transport system ATP-binding protein